MRPNERFSRHGRSRHVCRGCAKLGAEELAFRQGARNIDGLLSRNGTIPRRHRKAFEAYLHHPSPRLRQYAAEVQAAWSAWREGPAGFDCFDDTLAEPELVPEGLDEAPFGPVDDEAWCDWLAGFDDPPYEPWLVPEGLDEAPSGPVDDEAWREGLTGFDDPPYEPWSVPEALDEAPCGPLDDEDCPF